MENPIQPSLVSDDQVTTSQPQNDGGSPQIVENVNDFSSKKRQRSTVWEHYTVEKDGQTKKKYGTCNYCKVVRYEANSRIGTSNFRKHLERCSEYRKIKPAESSTTSKPIDLKVFHDFLAEAVLRHSLPYSFVEYEVIRKMCEYLNDNVDTITRNTVKKVCSDKYVELKEKVKVVLKKTPGRISLTCDTWTSSPGRGYLCVTAHYIDETWRLCSTLLCFRHLKHPHGGYELSSEIGNVLHDWEIERKIFCLTADNASNMDKTTKLLKDGTMLKDLVCKGKYFHIRCCAHILNLIVKNGLKVIDDSVVKLREGIKYIDGSEARFSKFFAIAKRTPNISFNGGLWLDVATRWNSTYMMLDRALKYRDALDLYFEGLGSDYVRNYQLGSDEWTNVNKIMNLLKPFYEITTMFSGSDYPTTNLYLPQVYLIRARLKNPIDDIDTPEHISKAIEEMKHKFNKYWDDYVIVLSFAVIFYPRLKFKFVEFCFNKTYGALGAMKYEELKLNFDELFKEYQNMYGIHNSTQIQENMAHIDLEIDLECDSIEDFEAFDQLDRSKCELDKYLQEDRLPMTQELDVLNYWREHSTIYPIFSDMARDILSIPITSVASESTFSTSGRIICKSRCALMDSNIEKLVTCKHWLTGYDDFTIEGVPVGNVSSEEDQKNSDDQNIR